MRHLATEIENMEHILSELQELRAAEPRLQYLAKIYDPIANQSPLWVWGNSTMPNDLPQIIENRLGMQIGDCPIRRSLNQSSICAEFRIKLLTALYFRTGDTSMMSGRLLRSPVTPPSLIQSISV